MISLALTEFHFVGDALFHEGHILALELVILELDLIEFLLEEFILFSKGFVLSFQAVHIVFISIKY